VIAERSLAKPEAPFSISLSQQAGRGAQAENVRIELRCADRREPFFSQSLQNGANTLRVSDTPECDQMMLGINARAFRGEPTLSGELGQITIR